MSLQLNKLGFNISKKALLKEFVDWFGSSELQKEWSDKFGLIPANKSLEQEKMNSNSLLIVLKTTRTWLGVYRKTSILTESTVEFAEQ